MLLLLNKDKIEENWNFLATLLSSIDSTEFKSHKALNVLLRKALSDEVILCVFVNKEELQKPKALVVIGCVLNEESVSNSLYVYALIGLEQLSLTDGSLIKDDLVELCKAFNCVNVKAVVSDTSSLLPVYKRFGFVPVAVTLQLEV